MEGGDYRVKVWFGFGFVSFVFVLGVHVKPANNGVTAKTCLLLLAFACDLTPFSCFFSLSVSPACSGLEAEKLVKRVLRTLCKYVDSNLNLTPCSTGRTFCGKLLGISVDFFFAVLRGLVAT